MIVKLKITNNSSIASFAKFTRYIYNQSVSVQVMAAERVPEPLIKRERGVTVEHMHFSTAITLVIQ